MSETMERRIKDGEEKHWSLDGVLSVDERLEKLEKEMSGVKNGLFWHDFDHKWRGLDLIFDISIGVLLILVGFGIGTIVMRAIAG